MFLSVTGGLNLVVNPLRFMFVDVNNDITNILRVFPAWLDFFVFLNSWNNSVIIHFMHGLSGLLG